MNPWALPDLSPINSVGFDPMKELFVPPQPIWNARDYQRQRQMTIGDLLLENHPGRGATFIVRLPKSKILEFDKEEIV